LPSPDVLCRAALVIFYWSGAGVSLAANDCSDPLDERRLCADAAKRIAMPLGEFRNCRHESAVVSIDFTSRPAAISCREVMYSNKLRKAFPLRAFKAEQQAVSPSRHGSDKQIVA
jgi:hypothetical protein